MTLPNPINEITGSLYHYAPGYKILLSTFIAVSWYNATELLILIFCTFRRYRGLYFWSLLVSSCLGVTPYSLGFLFKFFSTYSPFLGVSLLTVGWWCMVTGQSMVLYSRLHLVVRDERLLRKVLIMIWVNFVVLHIPTTVLTYGSNARNVRSGEFVRGYNIMEKIQMTGFTVQELIISGLYIWETIRLLKLGWDENKRRIMHRLVGINVVMLLLDLILLALEYANQYAVQITLKGMFYSIKLKLEFAVLGKLVDVVSGERLPSQLVFEEPGVPLNPVGTSVASSSRLLDARPVHTPESTAQTVRQGVSSGKNLSLERISTWVERQRRNDS